MGGDGACKECGKEPLYVDGARIDACFGDKLPYPVISACCGHGGRKPAYVRIATDPNHYLDICGGVVMPFGEYVDNVFQPARIQALVDKLVNEDAELLQKLGDE